MNLPIPLSFRPSLVVRWCCFIFLLADILLQPWLASLDLTTSDVGFYRDLGLKVFLDGTVVGEPDVRSSGQNLIFEVTAIRVPDSLTGHMQELKVHGKVMVKAQRYPEYFFGEQLVVACQLETPPVFPKFSYAALLAKDAVFALCTRPAITRVNDGKYRRGAFFIDFWKAVFWLKGKILSRTNELFAEPSASLVAGILFGQRRAIPQETLDAFNTTGLTHVLAVSGYNVSMMITVFGYIFQKAARRWRMTGMFGGVLLLVAFTGFSSSVLRAAWMGCITLLAEIFGRKGRGLQLLLVSGVIMVLVSPRMVLVDMSFQLSFLSTLGILLFMPKIEQFEKNLLEQKRSLWVGKIPAFMREGFYVTLAAQVFTTPLLIFQFGRVSLIAPFANIFVLPLVPWIMLTGFGAMASSYLFFPLGQFVAALAHTLVVVMLGIVKFFATVPFASVQL